MEQRILIIDMMHLVHTLSYAPYELKGYIEINGRVQQVSVKLHKGIVSAIHNWSHQGRDKVIVCVDRPTIARKEYFRRINEEQGLDAGYKDGRKRLPDSVYEAVEQIIMILREAGIPVCACNNYEADDLIYAVVQRCKKNYTDIPIDIVTNDADMLPLVDDQVSVFLRSTKFSRAERSDLLKKHYIQITPRNYEQEVCERGEFKKFRVPYNSVLLYKLLRGDKSDNIQGIPRRFAPKKYNAMIEKMEEDGVDFSTIFRYGECPKEYTLKETGKVVDSIEGLEKGTYKIKYKKPKELENILEVMRKYTDGDEEVLKHIERVYKGINLNQVYTEPCKGGLRLPAKIDVDPKEYKGSVLQAVLRKWNIRLR